MESLDTTVELIPVSEIESILFHQDVYESFINKTGDYYDKELEKYIKPLNEYMELCSDKSIDLSEEVFDRINEINVRYDGGQRFDYLMHLLNTHPIVSIEEIESILYDEETYQKFMKYYENTNIFPLNIMDYLAALNDYYEYIKKSYITLDNDAIARFNNIKLVYALHYKNMITLSGKPSLVSIAPELEREILDAVDLSKSKFCIARSLYIELNKRCTYSVVFTALSPDKKRAKKIFDGKVDKDGKKYEVVCSTWAMIYAHLLKSVGIPARVVGKLHRYVEFDCDGTHMKADATNVMLGEDGLFTDDLTRCQLGLPTVGFECLEENKDISYVLAEADKDIEYYHETKESLTCELAREYKEKYMFNKSITIMDKVEFLKNVAAKSKLNNFELVKYLRVVFDVIFDNEEKQDVFYKFVAFGKNKAGIVISYENNNGEFEFILFGKDTIQKCNASQLNRMIDRKRVIIVGKNKKIHGLERNESDGINRWFKR